MELIDFIQGLSPSLELVCVCMHYLLYLKEFLCNTHLGMSLWQARQMELLDRKRLELGPVAPASFRSLGLHQEEV